MNHCAGINAPFCFANEKNLVSQKLIDILKVTHGVSDKAKFLTQYYIIAFSHNSYGNVNEQMRKDFGFRMLENKMQ